MCATGRCLTFDASAAGYVRGDGVVSVGVKAQNQLVDGKYVSDEDEALASIAGATMNNNGKAASLAAPNGPAEQEAIAEAIRNASISPTDVDAVECFASGAFLPDAIEVGSMARSHRSEESRDPPLLLTAVKSIIGNQIETSGLTAVLKLVHTMRGGISTPNLHLRQANPHTDLEDQPVSIVTENMEYQRTSSFNGVMSRGFGGSNVYFIMWGSTSAKQEQHTVISQRDQIMFWPGGGGALESEALPVRSYTIVGSWSQWTDPEPMEAEGNGVYGFTVVLSETRHEQFQIWLDGESTRVLHPGNQRGYKDATVFGPDNMGHGCNWMIDGRQEVPEAQLPKELGKDGLLRVKDESTEGSQKLPTADFGLPGDAYRVKLRVVGRWRTVTWEKLPRNQAAGLAEQFQRERVSQFYICGSWNDWNLQEMTEQSPGVYQSTAVLWRNGGEFQILRNRDWSQVLHPAAPRTSLEALGSVEGPDEKGHGFNWFLNGLAGDSFRIEFTRLEGEMRVTWEKLSEVSQSRPSQQRYCIVGSWNSWTAEDMAFDGKCYKCSVQLGPKGEESFQVLLDGLWERTLHPDRPDASPAVTHVLQGPSISAHGMNWTIGRNDGGRAGDRYEVRLMLTRSGLPRSVEWSKID